MKFSLGCPYTFLVRIGWGRKRQTSRRFGEKRHEDHALVVRRMLRCRGVLSWGFLSRSRSTSAERRATRDTAFDGIGPL